MGLGHLPPYHARNTNRSIRAPIGGFPDTDAQVANRMHGRASAWQRPRLLVLRRHHPYRHSPLQWPAPHVCHPLHGQREPRGAAAGGCIRRVAHTAARACLRVPSGTLEPGPTGSDIHPRPRLRWATTLSLWPRLPASAWPAGVHLHELLPRLCRRDYRCERAQVSQTGVGRREPHDASVVGRQTRQHERSRGSRGQHWRVTSSLAYNSWDCCGRPL